MPGTGLEPARLKARVPETRASANSATPAGAEGGSPFDSGKSALAQGKLTLTTSSATSAGRAGRIRTGSLLVPNQVPYAD